MLNRGDLGVDIAEWQAFLRDKGYRNAMGRPLAVNGDFGNDTEHATMGFQHDHGLERTGVLCPGTETAARGVGWRKL
jgi:putative chitinase